MDRIEKYKTIVKKIVHEIALLGKREDDPVQPKIIEDDAKGHYLIFSDGWRGERRVYGCYLHLEVRNDGKVWLQYDGTDMEVALQLIENGIPKSDIVLGFQPPFVRPDTGFAIA